MSTTHKTINTFSIKSRQERETMAWQLQEIEAQFDRSKEFSDNKKFNSDLAMATGFSGTLSMDGFQAIVDFVAEDVGSTLNEFGHVDHKAIIESEFGPLLRTIIYLLCFSFGTAHAKTILKGEGGSNYRTEMMELAQGFSQRLVLTKEESQRTQPKETILQMVVRKQMGTKKLFVAIKTTLKGFITDYFEQVKRGIKPNIFKRVPLLEDVRSEDDAAGSYLIPKSTDIWNAYDQEQGRTYAQQLLLEAIEQLNDDQKHVLRVMFNLNPELYENRQLFRTQIAAIHKQAGISKRRALELADEIVVSIRDYLDITVVERSVKTLVPVHCSKAVLAKRTTQKAASFKMVEKEVREDYFVSSLLETEHLDDLLSEINRAANSTLGAIIAKLN